MLRAKFEIAAKGLLGLMPGHGHDGQRVRPHAGMALVQKDRRAQCEVSMASTWSCAPSSWLRPTVAIDLDGLRPTPSG